MKHFHKMIEWLKWAKNMYEWYIENVEALTNPDVTTRDKPVNPPPPPPEE